MAQNSTDDPATAPKGQAGFNARLVVHAIKRHPVVMAVVLTLAGAAGAAVWFFLPLPKLTGAVVFRVASSPPAVLTATIDNSADLTSYRSAQAALIKRRLLLNKVLNQPEVRDLPAVRQHGDQVAWLESELKVETRNGSEFMRVTLEGNDADELRVILEALTKAYRVDVDDRDNGARRNRLAKLDETYRGYRAELERYRKREESIALAIGSRYGSIIAQLDALLDADLKLAIQDLAQAQRERALAEAACKEAQSAEPALPPLPWNMGRSPGAPAIAAAVEAQLSHDLGLRQLEEGVARARKQLVATQKLYTERVEAVVKAEDAVREAEEKRDRYRETIRPEVEADVRKQLNVRSGDRLDTLRGALSLAINREKLAEARLQDVRDEIKRKSEYQGELNKLEFDIRQTESLSVTLANEIERLKVELRAPPRVTVAEEPFVVPGIEGKRRLKYTAILVIAVLLVGVGGVTFWESRLRRLTHPDDLATALGVRLLGTVPVAGAGSPYSPHILAESIDATRTMLLNGTHEPNLRVLVVTSAVSGEGKTSLTGHLAISLARAGFRTLLVDGDLRVPTAQRVFNVPLTPGLCEVLGGGEIAPAVYPSGVPGLSVMPAGQWCPAAKQGLVGDRWRWVVEQLKRDFEFVIVDSSPLLLVSDALLLAKGADGVVVSVLMGVSQLNPVQEAVGRVQQVRAKVLGVIANGVQLTAHQYMHRYYTARYDESNLPVLPALPAKQEPEKEVAGKEVPEKSGPQEVTAEK